MGRPAAYSPYLFLLLFQLFLCGFFQIRNTSYYVILMDVQMPEMTTENIRRQKYPQPYIVAVTANALAKDREICIRSGLVDYRATQLTISDFSPRLKKATIIQQAL
jgi:CheY-like chemotaxis protein